MSQINKWLAKKISKYSDHTNKEYINNIFSILYKWLSINDKLYLKYSPDETLKYFYIFIYNKNIFMNTSCDMIDIYFTSNIVDIFFDIRKKYGGILLDEMNITPDDLLIFLNHVSWFYEEDNINEEEEIIHSEEILM